MPSSSVTKKPLLRMLWCESVAPLGKPVVPLVYWMLIGSSKDSSAMRAAIASRSGSPAQNSSHSGRSTKTVRSSVSTAPETSSIMAA